LRHLEARREPRKIRLLRLALLQVAILTTRRCPQTALRPARTLRPGLKVEQA
jgi:hypothetical protein